MPLDQVCLTDVRERQVIWWGQDLDGAGRDPAMAAVGGGMGDRSVLPGQGVKGIEQAGLVVLGQEGDKLRHVRAALPCEVLVTAVTHPLFGSRLIAYAFRHVDGVLHLKVRLPEGLPGLVRADVTDVHGDGQERPGLALDVAGLRELRVLVLRLRDGMAGSAELAKDAR